jgi:hypothetical protein
MSSVWVPCATANVTHGTQTMIKDELAVQSS